MSRNVMRDPIPAVEILSSGWKTNTELSHLVTTGRLQAYMLLTINQQVAATCHAPAADTVIQTIKFIDGSLRSVCYKLDIGAWESPDKVTISNWDNIIFKLKDLASLGYIRRNDFDFEVNHLFLHREKIASPIAKKNLRNLRNSTRRSPLREYYESETEPASVQATSAVNGPLNTIKTLELRIEKLETIIRNIEPACTRTPSPRDKVGSEGHETLPKAYKFGEVTQEAAAKMCGVSVRTFQSWEKGERKPKISGFPGRSNLTALLAWSYAFKDYQQMVKPAKAMGRAQSMSPDDIEKFATTSAWDNDD